jgi:phospholipase C
VSGRRSDDAPRNEAEERLLAEHPEAYLRRRDFLARAAALAGAAGLAAALPVDTLLSEAAKREARAAPLPSPGELPVDTFVVLMMENRSFDHYFGSFPDADGRNTGLSYPDAQGGQHPTHPLAPDFQGCGFKDPDHGWDGGRVEYGEGRLDGFYIANDEYAIGYYLEQDLGFISHAARAFTLYDRYFCSLLGPTWPNRLYMHSAQCGGNKENGGPIAAVQQGLAGDGLYKWETIWDRMLQNGLSVAYYSSDQPFIGVFGKRFVPVVKPIAQYYVDAEAGNLPNLAFIDPPFLDGGGGDGLSGDEHPAGDIRIGQAFMSDVSHAFLESPQFSRGAMFINYDEWGGFFDHVVPPTVPDDLESPDLEENFGQTGFRIPGVAISPYARRAHVSHMTVTHESILKLISYKFGLGYLNKRHRYASNVGESFDWANPDFDVPALPSPAVPLTTPCSLQGLLTPAQRRDERRDRRDEGLEIGDPLMTEYFERLGYPVEPATPERVFRNPDSVNSELGELWAARQPGR